jgi:hypothetical protein
MRLVQRFAARPPREASANNLELDPVKAKQKQRLSYFHRVQLPALRLLGMSLVVLLVILNNFFIFNPLQGAIPRSLLRSRSDAFSF